YVLISSSQGHCPHRPPPPFPTRRSSDLSYRARHPLAVSSRCSSAVFVPPAAAHASTSARNASTAVGHRRPRPPCGRSSSASRRQDRKSTRLNSSHVSISYAVFCLKKKSS